MLFRSGLAAWAWGGEQFSAHKLLGAGVILGGVALAQFSPSRPQPQPGVTAAPGA